MIITKMKRFLSICIFSILIGQIVTGCQSHSRPSSATSGVTSEITNLTEISVTDPTESSSINGAEIIRETVSTETRIEIEYGSPALYIDKDARRDFAVIMSNGEAREVSGILSSYEYSLNRAAVAMLFDAKESGGGRLLYSDGTTEKEVAEKVMDYRISDNGKAIVYLVEKDVTGKETELFIYTGADAKSQLIFENVQPQFCVSPNGETVVFVASEEAGEKRTACLLWRENEALVEVSRDMVPIAVSDDGRNVYLLREDTQGTNRELWAYCDGKMILLSDALYQYGDSILINSDGTQVLYDDSDGLCLFEKNEPVTISKNRSIEPIDPNRSSKSLAGETDIFVYNTGTDSLRYTFFEMHHRTGTGVDYAYIDDIGGYIPIATTLTFLPGENFRQSGNTMLFTDLESGKLMYIPDVCLPDYINGYSAKAGDIIYEDARFSDFCLTRDGTAFYTDSDNNVVRYDGQRNEIVGSGYQILGCYSRPDEPDIVFLGKSKVPGDDPVSEYVSSYYYDLYIIEDVAGLEPVFIEENVGQVFFLEGGVYCLSLKDVADGIRDYYSNPEQYDEFNRLSAKDSFDVNNLKYSEDGTTFETVGVVERVYQQGG